MKSIKKLAYYFCLASIITSCGAVDLRTSTVLNDPNSTEQNGRLLLENSMKKMGYEAFSKTKVYEATAQFKWKGIWLTMPMNSFPGNNKKDLRFRFATNTFDGQIEYLEGRKQGTIQGIQSWQGYKTEVQSDFLKQHEHDRYLWGLATYHYILESPLRMLEATIIRYAGEKEQDGELYDLVYATWGSEAPNKNYDRWLIYINKKTGFIDLTEVTINDFFVPMPKSMQHGTVRFERELTSIGTYMPSKVQIQLQGPKEKDNYVYYFTVKNYVFDHFSKDELYPIEGLPFYGNTKPLD